MVQIAAQPRPRGPLRLGVPDPAQGRHRSRSSGPLGTRHDFTDLHAWAEVYRAGRGLDRARRHLGPAVRRGPHPARRDPALPGGRAPISRRPRPVRDRIPSHDGGDARRRGAPHLRFRSPTRHGRRSTRSAGSVDVEPQEPPMCASRPAASRRSSRSTISRRRNGARDAVGPDQARPRRQPDPPVAHALRARRLPALRSGQMVPGREPAALGLLALLAQGRKADLAATPSLIASETGPRTAKPR